MLNVGLLGEFRVAGVDNRTWSELGPAGRGLASFLFTYPGRPHRRERLADLFWPELDAERARRALNSAIWRLRKLLASDPESQGSDSLQTVGSETVLASAPWLDIDASALEHAATTDEFRWRAQVRSVTNRDRHVADSVEAVFALIRARLEVASVTEQSEPQDD